jgi:hypothetical protein
MKLLNYSKAPKSSRYPREAGLSGSQSKRARGHYTADFETTTDREDCRVWSWGIANVLDPKTVTFGLDIAAFVEHVKGGESYVWFHNLGFDGKFLLDWLMRNGYHYTVLDGGNAEGTFKTLINGFGSIFNITVQWIGGGVTEFRDSYKKIPLNLAKVAKSFKMDMAKGDIDYHKERPIGYQPTPEEWEYLRLDVSIMATAMSEVIGNGMTKLTASGDAFAEYKSLVSTKAYNYMFPVFSTELDAELRRAYRGGWTYCDPRFSKVQTRSGLVLDVNSLYPFIMANELIPYGEPLFVEGQVLPTEDRPLTIFSVEFIAKIKPDHVPTIQIKNNMSYMETEYLREISEPVTLMVTNVDWELYNEHYDITVISWGNGYAFRAAKGMFKTYIDKWSKIKAEAVGGQRTLAKGQLNNLYGKFATNPVMDGKYPIFEDDKIKFKHSPEVIKDPVYTPAGVFITSHARALTVRAAQANYGTFAYADTDSLHLLTDDLPDAIEIDPNKMGAWKLEYRFQSAYYMRAKGYSEKLFEFECARDHDEFDTWDNHGEHCLYVTHVAGMPEKIAHKLTFDDLYDGNVLPGKLVPKIVPGGVVLIDTTFTLKI